MVVEGRGWVRGRWGRRVRRRRVEAWGWGWVVV
jgi:hypothetical protein